VTELWDHTTCKAVIELSRLRVAPEIKRNWHESIVAIAQAMRVSPEELYNNVFPDDVVTRIGGKWAAEQLRTRYKVGALIAAEKARGPSGPKTMKPLPGKPMNAAARAAAEEAQITRDLEEEAEAEQWSEGEGRMIAKRAAQLEEGDSPYASEEAEGHSSAIASLVLAARRGTAKRNARQLAEAVEGERRRVRNAAANKRWTMRANNNTGARGPGAELLALAAEHGTNANLKAVYNGVPGNAATGTLLPGRNPHWQNERMQFTYKRGGPRGANWEAPAAPHPDDYLMGDAKKEIMEQVYEEFPISGPNKKLPERALYDKIMKALGRVRYEKGYEDPETHQPRLDLYDQALSRAAAWRRAGRVDAEHNA